MTKNNIKLKTINTRLKHLRGRHNQLDHAWNRGMGRGGGGVAPNQMGPLPTQDFYRKRKINLMNQMRAGEITQAEMRNELRSLRGITAEPTTQNTTTENNTLTLGNRARALVTQARQIADGIRPKIGSIMERINALLQRAGRDTTTQNTTQDSPTTEIPLPAGYDTTRFDRPTQFAPRPIKREMLQPGSKLYERLLAEFKAGTGIEIQGEQHPTDAFIMTVTHGEEYIPQSRWQIKYINNLNILRDMLSNLGIVTDPISIEGNATWNNYLTEYSQPVTGDLLTDDNPYMQYFIRNMQSERPRSKITYGEDGKIIIEDYTPEEQKIEMQERLTPIKHQLNRYLAAINANYDDLTVIAQQAQGWYESIKSKIEEKIQQLEEELTKNPYNNDARFQLRELQKIKEQVDNPLITRRLANDLTIYDLHASDLHFQSILYEVLGYDALPSTAPWNELSQNPDALTFPGQSVPIMFYRSIRDAGKMGFNSASSSGTSTITADEIYRQMLSSERAHVGMGIDGNGMYAKSRSARDVGNEEAADGREIKTGRERYGDHTFTFTLNKNARVLMDFVSTTEEHTDLSNMISSIREEFQSRYGIELPEGVNIGAVMAMLGYEAYQSREDFHGGINWVILNRAIMNISDRYVGPDASQEELETLFTTGRLP